MLFCARWSQHGQPSKATLAALWSICQPQAVAPLAAASLGRAGQGRKSRADEQRVLQQGRPRARASSARARVVEPRSGVEWLPLPRPCLPCPRSCSFSTRKRAPQRLRPRPGLQGGQEVSGRRTWRCQARHEPAPGSCGSLCRAIWGGAPLRGESGAGLGGPGSGPCGRTGHTKQQRWS